MGGVIGRQLPRMDGGQGGFGDLGVSGAKTPQDGQTMTAQAPTGVCA